MPALFGSERTPGSDTTGTLQAYLVRKLGGVPETPWGHAWALKRNIVVLVPWNRLEEMQEPPVIFMDETYEESRQVFAYGALVMGAWEAIMRTLWYLESLLLIRAQIPGFGRLLRPRRGCICANYWP